MSYPELEEILSNIKNLSEDHAFLIKILMEEEDVYTNKGRLNKSSLTRIMGKSSKEIEDLFYDCRKEFMK